MLLLASCDWKWLINFSFTWWTIHLTLGISSYYRLEVARCWILHYGLPLPRPLSVFEVGALFALFEFFLDASGYSAEKLRSETAPFSEKSLIHMKCIVRIWDDTQGRIQGGGCNPLFRRARTPRSGPLTLTRKWRCHPTWLCRFRALLQGKQRPKSSRAHVTL